MNKFLAVRAASLEGCRSASPQCFLCGPRLQQTNVGNASVFRDLFVHKIMRIRTGCYLRSMGNAHYLVALAEFLQNIAHFEGNITAHSVVDFVKNEGR